LVRITPGTGQSRLTVALAGHPLPALVRCDGSIELVGEAALPLGLFEEFEAKVIDVVLNPGDSLVLYTDGVTEARVHGGEPFGERRMLDALAHTAGRPAQEQVDHLMDSLTQHAEAPSDDTAVVVLRMPPQLPHNG
jgi:serine phosphatase RsbU (regulator of sigma subunit)